MRLLLALLTTLVIAGCGGACGAGSPPFNPRDAEVCRPDPGPVGGGGDQVGTMKAAEGFWVGQAGPYDFAAVFLEDGEVWSLYSLNGIAEGVGWARLDNELSAFSGSGYDYNLRAGARTAARIDGQAIARSEVSGVITAGTVRLTFAGRYDAAYEQPPSLQPLVGRWTAPVITAVGLVTTTVEIRADGTASSTNQFCTSTGTITPRPSGRNVFDLRATFSGTNCEFAGRTLSGVVISVQRDGVRSVFAMALLPDRSRGFFMVGQR